MKNFEKVSHKYHAHKTGTLGTVYYTRTYNYNNNGWGDRLVSPLAYEEKLSCHGIKMENNNHCLHCINYTIIKPISLNC